MVSREKEPFPTGTLSVLKFSAEEVTKFLLDFLSHCEAVRIWVIGEN